jgi:oligopeptide/dipeptide ABC transporter ATP-binding protein
MGNNVVLDAKHVKKYFPVKGMFGKIINNVKAVDDVSISLYDGETVGLVGETGCGKSTFGRTIIKLVKPTEGEIDINGKNITNYSDKQMRDVRKDVQMVFQDPYTSLNPRKKIGSILEEVLEIQGIKEDRQGKVLEILEKVGLRKEHYYRYPHEFSGGQRQRIGMARALILNPKIIICDEPVSALDVSIQAQIVNLLQDLQIERNLTYLFIAHDMSVVKYISDRIAVMYLGHIMEMSETEELFSKPLHPYTKSLLSAVPIPNPHIKKQRIVMQGDVPSPLNPPSGCVFHGRCPYVKPVCKETRPEMKEVSTGHCIACHLYD